MATQDKWVKTQVRLPPELHAKLVKSQGAASLNSEIIRRLEQSFDASVRRGTASFEVRLDSAGRAMPLAEIRRRLSELVLNLEAPFLMMTINIITPEDEAELQMLRERANERR